MNDAMRPPGKGPVQTRININLNELPPVGCPNCECQVLATNIAMYRKLGATQSPTGKAMLAMIPLSLCQDCGAVSQVVGDELKLIEMVPVDGEADDADKPDD